MQLKTSSDGVIFFTVGQLDESAVCHLRGPVGDKAVNELFVNGSEGFLL